MPNIECLLNVLNALVFLMASMHVKYTQEQNKMRIVRRRRLRRFHMMRWRKYSDFMQQRTLLITLLVNTAFNEQDRQIPRQVWTRPRTSAVWEEMLHSLTDSQWREHFRMTRTTFVWLCNKLRPYISRQDTRLRKCVEVEKRVALTLWRLATNVEFRTIGTVFGVARSTACQIVHDTINAIVNVLQEQFLSFPSGDRLQEIIDGFELRWGFPQTAGAIDGTHIPIMAPKHHPAG